MLRDSTSERRWLEHSTALLLRVVGDLDEDQLDADTDLPGWTRRHVVSHLHFNAEALRRLVSWAATGVEQRMYESPGQRAEEIERGATLDRRTLCNLVAGSAQALVDDLDALPEVALRAEVVTAQGRVVPASEVAWLRTREVAVHLVDLGCGVGFGDLPPDLVRALVVDAAAKHAGGPRAPELAAWLTGRTPVAPHLGAWL